MPRGSVTQSVVEPITQTQAKLRHGGYHLTNGGLLSIFQNMRIKLGAQVDIFTAFEKTKSAYHILNSWLRGKWDQKDIFAIIDRWDAWYGCNHYLWFNKNDNNNTSIMASFIGNEDEIPARQSDSPFERLLIRVLGKKGLLSTALTKGLENGTLMAINDNMFNQIIENCTFSFDKLHSLFQQNAMLPPGTQIIMEIDVPMYTNFDPTSDVVDTNPATATWSNIGWICPPTNFLPNGPVNNPNTDDLSFQPASYWDQQNCILVSINQSSVWNSIVMNCVNLKPEIARSLQDERIKRPLVYNFHQQIATTVGSFFPGQTVYNFTLPPNQAIPTQFLFGWINPTIKYAIHPNSLEPGYTLPEKMRHIHRFETNFNEENNLIFNPNPVRSKDGPSAFLYTNTPTKRGYFYGSSLTPLPVNYKRTIVRRGGFQEVYQYGNYYDGTGRNKYGFVASNSTTNILDSAIIQNAVELFGVKNLMSDPSQKYFDHLEEYQFDRKSLNGLGPIERRTKYSYTPQWLAEGKWQVFQLNPCKHDTGQYSSDQNAYTVDVQLELDLDLPELELYMGLNANSKLVCVRIMPAQLSYAIDGTVRIYTWPNLLISPNAVVSGNPPPAGPGGSV
jgi:hypothetical protein